jgi:general secretion pathway protein L
LALLAAALPFVQQSLAAAALDARIAALRPELTEAERLRRQIAASRGTADVVTAARGQIGQPMQALAVLTDVLPDDTVLSQLSARQRTLTLTGRAASAAKLIGSMTALPALRAPAFTAAVVRDEATGTEAFTIRTELAP